MTGSKNVQRKEYRLTYDNGIAVGRLAAPKAIDAQLFDVSLDAQRQCLLRDAYACAKAYLAGSDVFSDVPRMIEFQRIASFLVEKARDGFAYSIQSGASNDFASVYVEMTVEPLPAWRQLLPGISKVTIRIRPRRCAKIDNDGWGVIGKIHKTMPHV